MPERAIEVDGHRFATEFCGFSQPLVVHFDDREDGCLPPWTYGEHIAALRECSEAQGGRLHLDIARFTRCVLARPGSPPHVDDHVAPLALWWAAGGEPASAAPARSRRLACADPSVGIGSDRFRPVDPDRAAGREERSRLRECRLSCGRRADDQPAWIVSRLPQPLSLADAPWSIVCRVAPGMACGLRGSVPKVQQRMIG